MNKLTDGTEYRQAAGGIVATRGKRTLHILGTSVADTERARRLLASHSFDRLFRSARKSPASRNVAYIAQVTA